MVLTCTSLYEVMTWDPRDLAADKMHNVPGQQ